MKNEKLSLKKETVRKLNEEKLNGVVGGGAATKERPTTGSIGRCPCCIIIEPTV